MHINEITHAGTGHPIRWADPHATQTLGADPAPHHLPPVHQRTVVAERAQ